tara:strand:- start:301 stop:582 length:282 start_codon:yes stop_codon:yes gene_type:complete
MFPELKGHKITSQILFIKNNQVKILLLYKSRFCKLTVPINKKYPRELDSALNNMLKNKICNLHFLDEKGNVDILHEDAKISEIIEILVLKKNY